MSTPDLRIEIWGEAPANPADAHPAQHTVYCLHGIGGGAYWFRGLGERLRERPGHRHRIAALDLPGCGANREGRAPYGIEGCVEALAARLSRETEAVTVLGHSMGTLLALKLFAAIPERIRSLIFVGGLPQPRPLIHERLSERRLKILSGGMEGLGWGAASGVLSPGVARAQPEFHALFAQLWEAYDAQTYVEQIEALLAGSAWDVVPRVTVPCLLLAGRDDSYAPPEEIDRFAAALPNLVKRVEWPECGHMSFLEKPETFAEEVAAFLAGV